MPAAHAKPLVYLETSFISYLTAPFSADEKIARDQVASRRWWEEERAKCDLMVSFAVWREIGDGNPDKAKGRESIIKAIRSIPASADATRLANMLLAAHALPANSSTDALHIALASVAGADILLTWNCRHIANPVSLPKTVEVVLSAGFKCPALATPAQLLEATDEQSPA